MPRILLAIATKVLWQAGGHSGSSTATEPARSIMHTSSACSSWALEHLWLWASAPEG